MQQEQIEAVRSLNRNFELEIPELIPKEEILFQLEKYISQKISNDPEGFFQLMYRLDIPERAMDKALQNVNASLEIANLIYDRQLEKAKSRLYYRNKDTQAPGKDDKDLKW